MRLIDADYYCKVNGCSPPYGNDGECVNCCICDCPTIEAEPVRHGYWIPVDGGDTCDEWECSACGKWMVFQYDMDYDDMCEEFPRCPKCGAKMDGDPDV